jgi:adenylate kinase family enzyme
VDAANLVEVVAVARVNLLGASGSGKSTLGRAVAAALDCPYLDADTYFHEPTDPPFQKMRAPEERLRLLVQDLGVHRDWVLGGSLSSFGAHPLLDPTLVVFLWLPADVRLERLRRRERERFGARLDPGGDMHAGHMEFMAWAAEYDAGTAASNNVRIHETWLAQQTCPVLRVAGSLATAEQVSRVLRAIPAT